MKKITLDDVGTLFTDKVGQLENTPILMVIVAPNGDQVSIFGEKNEKGFVQNSNEKIVQLQLRGIRDFVETHK